MHILHDQECSARLRRKLNRAGLHTLQTAQHPGQGSFTGTIGANNAGDLAFWETHVGNVEHAPATKRHLHPTHMHAPLRWGWLGDLIQLRFFERAQPQLLGLGAEAEELLPRVHVGDPAAYNQQHLVDQPAEKIQAVFRNNNGLTLRLQPAQERRKLGYCRRIQVRSGLIK